MHEGLTIYTHVSDQHSTFGTQIIVSTERDATFTLDEILGNTTELPLLEHTTEATARRALRGTRRDLDDVLGAWPAMTCRPHGSLAPRSRREEKLAKAVGSDDRRNAS